MSKKPSVVNLSYTLSEEVLKEVFAPIGEVISCKITTDSSSGRSKGLGFVETANVKDADRAIASVHGTTVMNRAMNVCKARPQTDCVGGCLNTSCSGLRSSYNREGFVRENRRP